MEKNKKILMVSFRCPWPQDKGGYILRFLNIAKILAKNYKVDLLTIVKNKKEKQCVDDLKGIFNSVVYFYHPKFSEYFGALKAVFSSKPLQVGYYYSPLMAKWLKDNYKDYDLIFCSTIRTAEYVKKLNVRKCIDFIDAISLNYQQAVKSSKFPWKLIYSIENNRLLNYEREIADIFDLSFITTQKDKDCILKEEVRKMVVLPNGVKEELLKRKFVGKEENWLTFFGKMDYQPNEDACIFFAQEVFPKIKKIVPDIKFYIIGMNPTRKVLNLQKIEGVKVTGKVDDPYLYLEKAKVIIAPIRFGGGIQNKVLEGMALGKAVLTSYIGAAGITKAKDGEHLAVANHKKPEEMAEKAVRLLRDDESRQKIGRNAKKLILENYTWEKAEKRLFETLSLII